MKCEACPFIFTCWRGQQGEDLLNRNSVTACPDCGRWTVHIMAPLVASERGNNFHSRVDMHYVFFCEQRSTEENQSAWASMYFDKKHAVHRYRQVVDGRVGQLNVRGKGVGIVVCHICRGHDTRSPERRDYVINLDKEPYEEPFWRKPCSSTSSS